MIPPRKPDVLYASTNRSKTSWGIHEGREGNIGKRSLVKDKLAKSFLVGQDLRELQYFPPSSMEIILLMTWYHCNSTKNKMNHFPHFLNVASDIVVKVGYWQEHPKSPSPKRGICEFRSVGAKTKGLKWTHFLKSFPCWQISHLVISLYVHQWRGIPDFPQYNHIKHRPTHDFVSDSKWPPADRSGFWHGAFWAFMAWWVEAMPRKVAELLASGKG